MGAAVASSVSVTDIVNKSLTEVLMESSMNCTSQTNVNQEMVFSDIKTKGCNLRFGDISQEANVSVNLSCSQDTAQEADLQNKFSTKLNEDLEAAVSGLTIGFSSSESASYTNLLNEVKNKISVKNVVDCVTQTIAQQKMNFQKIEAECTDPTQKVSFDNIKQLIISTQVNNCIQKNSSATKAITDLQTEIEKTLKSKTEGVDMFASLGSLIILVMIIVFFIFSPFTGKDTISSIVTSVITSIIVGIIIYLVSLPSK